MTRKSRSWRTPLLLAATATTLSLLVVAVVGEWAVRYRERHRTTVPGTMSKLFYRHTRLMHGLERGSDYFGWVHVGPEGFRGARSVARERPDSVFRIIAVGGSTTFDATTSGDSSTWTSRLEQILDSIAAPRDVEVLNAGVPGFEVIDDLIRLESELHFYEPDLIILYQGHNDLFNTLSNASRAHDETFDPRPGEMPAIYPWQVWLERHSLLYHKLRSKWQALAYQWDDGATSGAAEPIDYAARSEAGIGRFATHVRAYVAVARSMGIDVLVPQIVYSAPGQTPVANSSLHDLWRRAVPFAPPEVVWEGYARIDSVTRASAVALGAAYVPSPDPELWHSSSYATDDPIHFSDLGALRFARHLATVLADRIAAGEVLAAR